MFLIRNMSKVGKTLRLIKRRISIQRACALLSSTQRQQEEFEQRESWTDKLQCPRKQTADERLMAVDKQGLSLLKITIITIIIIIMMSDKIKKSKNVRNSGESGSYTQTCQKVGKPCGVLDIKSMIM